MAYASLSDLTAYLGIDESTADDALLTQLLTRAQAAVDGMCQRTFEAGADSTRHYDCRSVDGLTLHLDADLCAVTSVVNGDGITVAPTSYTTEPRNLTPLHALRLRSVVGLAWDGISADIAVTGKWAYSMAAPADVVHASNFLEHIDDTDLPGVMSEIRRILKQEGRLILLQPNFRIASARYFDDYTHRRIWTDAGLSAFLMSEGFTIELSRPRFLPFSLRSRPSLIPAHPLVVRAYIHAPWKPFAGQMLVVERKK